jgi:uridylate kinase
VSIREVVEKRLGVIDLTAATMAEENHLALAVFDLRQKDSISNALEGKNIGTFITAD